MISRIYSKSWFFRSGGLAILAIFCLLSLAQADDKANTKNTPTESEEEQVVERLVCTHQKEVRRIEVHTKQAGCQTLYFKSGKANQIALSRRGVELCKQVAQKTRTTLERGNFQCK